MFLLAYLCSAGLILLLALVVLAVALPAAERRLARSYGLPVLASLVTVVIAGALFVVLSIWSGLFTLGTVGSWNFPGDYLAAGPIGWLVILVAFAGMLSPAIIGYLIWRASRTRDQTNGDMVG
jgi:hypothetical protein